MKKKHAIVCMSGGYKSVFTHGVLSAFEYQNYYVNAYAGCSSSAIISTLAALKSINQIDTSLWLDGFHISKIEGNSQSNAILHSIDELFPIVPERLWDNDLAKIFIATSFVKTTEGTQIVEGDSVKRFGQKLLIDALRNRAEWRDENLELQVFGTEDSKEVLPLSLSNFKDVLYASTRMLHAWDIPAYIESKSYIDGSYTSLCPAKTIANIGYNLLTCILTEHSNKKYDMFSSEELPPQIKNSHLNFIQPDMNLKDIGIDFYDTDSDSLKKAFIHGFAGKKRKRFRLYQDISLII